MVVDLIFRYSDTQSCVIVFGAHTPASSGELLTFLGMVQRVLLFLIHEKRGLPSTLRDELEPCGLFRGPLKYS